jgi:hypothetical protein
MPSFLHYAFPIDAYAGETARAATWPSLLVGASLLVTGFAFHALRPPSWMDEPDSPALPPQPVYRASEVAPDAAMVAPSKGQRPGAKIVAGIVAGMAMTALLFVLPWFWGRGTAHVPGGFLILVDALWGLHALVFAGLLFRLVARPPPAHRFGVAAALLAGVVLVVGYVHAVSLRSAALVELRSRTTTRVHEGQHAVFVPETMGWRSSGFLGLSRSYGRVDLDDWTLQGASLYGDQRGTKVITLRASGPFIELERAVPVEVGAPGTPEFPLAYGSDWVLASDDLVLRWVVVGAGMHNGLETRVIDAVWLYKNGREQHDAPRYVYAWEGQWFNLATEDGGGVPRPFFTGALHGTCGVDVLVGYTCTCDEKGDTFAFPSVTKCTSGDLSSGAERAIVGIFTLGFGSGSHYRTLRLVRAARL